MTLTVFVTTRNRPDVMRECVDHIEAQGVPFDGVLLDNSDEPVQCPKGWAYLRGPAPLVSYSLGANWCLREMDAANDLLTVSDDAMMQPGCLKAMVDHDDADIVGAVMTASDGVVNHAGGFMRSWFPLHEGRGADPSTLTCHKVPWVTGAVCLYRRSALDAVGNFDEGFRFCFEDADYALRATALGLHVLVCADAHAQHDEHGIRDPKLYAAENMAHWRSKWGGIYR